MTRHEMVVYTMLAVGVAGTVGTIAVAWVSLRFGLPMFGAPPPKPIGMIRPSPPDRPL